MAIAIGAVGACAWARQPSTPAPQRLVVADVAAAEAAPERHARGLGTISINQLLDWAERSWPALFPPGAATQSLTWDGRAYTLRHYSGTGNFVGVAADGGVWGYGQFTGLVLRPFDHISDYTCLVAPDQCRPKPAGCVTAIDTGFNGDLDAVYGAGDGGGGAADGDSGSAGVGASEGKVLGGRIRVIRLADGALLGEGVTDSQRGLATLAWCRADLPLMLELRGAPGARYFDEARNELVEFPLLSRLRALVDRFDENVGVSALTEAAYLYAMNNLARDPAPIRAGREPLVTEGVPVGLTADQVRHANAAVLSELNRHFTDSLAQPSMKALGTPIDSQSAPSALPRNRYGQVAAMTGGFARVARSFDPDAATPALKFAGELGADLSDGVIDGVRLDRQPASAGPRKTYDRSTTAGHWALGRGLMGARFGQATTLVDGEPYLAKTWLAYYLGRSCTERGWAFADLALYKSGAVVRRTIEVAPDQCAAGNGAWAARARHDTLAREALSITPPTYDSGAAFIVLLDGSVLALGDATCGRLGNGVVERRWFVEPVRLTALSRVVKVVDGWVNHLALTGDGSVWAWGRAETGLLGRDDRSGVVGCVHVFDDGSQLALQAAPTPQPIPGLSGVTDVTVAEANYTALALTLDGRVQKWGNGAVEWVGGSGRTPVRFNAIDQVKAIAASWDSFFALRYDGSVWGWGNNRFGALGDGSTTRRAVPVRVPGVQDVVDIRSRYGVSLALKPDGSTLVWFGVEDAGVTSIKTPAPGAGYPVYFNAERQTAPLPRAVRLTSTSNGPGFIGADGNIYAFSSAQGGRWFREEYTEFPPAPP